MIIAQQSQGQRPHQIDAQEQEPSDRNAPLA